MIKIKELDNYIISINKQLDKIQFQLGHQYDYYTIELYIVESVKESCAVYNFKGIIYGGTKHECYNFLASFMHVLSLGKIKL